MAIPAQPAATGGTVSDYRFLDASRLNNPPAGLAAQGLIAEARPRRYAYDPHLPPVLRFDPTGEADGLPELLAEARRRRLTEEEVQTLAAALRTHEPWLEWAGKAEAQRSGFAVDPVALHIHERVAAKAVLAVARRQDVQRSFFADPELGYREAIQFYRHEVDWANRLILGDSLQVMSSLAAREGLAGKVQTIYIDPPYGIKFASNFQPLVGRRDVKDRPQDLTRDPEMVRAYRDTWSLGTHSYMRYLRDRLLLARELLSDGGSIFVQIGDENVHLVRAILDEVFGLRNFCSQIQFRKTGYASTNLLPNLFDYLLWYAKDIGQLKYRATFNLRSLGSVDTAFFDTVELPSGERRQLTPVEKADPEQVPEDAAILARNPLVSPGYIDSLSQSIRFGGTDFRCPPNAHWKTTPTGIARLIGANRIIEKGNTIRMVRYLADLAISPTTNIWSDTGVGGFVGDDRLYAVQTDTRVIERCLLMTTDPGDLVLDPTSGSGTTAYVAEKWGRRWIAIDTSRVANAIARQRLLTASFDYYRLQDEAVGVADGFVLKTVPHVTLKSIAQNQALDSVFARHDPILAERLASLNDALNEVTPAVRAALSATLAENEKRNGKRSVPDANRRRWHLPMERWEEWQVPFDADPGWPAGLRNALAAYRAAWRAKKDEVNATIAASAEQEALVDQPEVVKGIKRVAGPFTVESVLPPEAGLDGDAGNDEASPVDPYDDELVTFSSTNGHVAGNARTEPQNAEAHQDQIIRMIQLLAQDGARFLGNRTVSFDWLTPLPGDPWLHAEGAWRPDGGTERSIAASIGPQFGDVSAVQVERALHTASRRGYHDLLFAGFGFDATAQAVIQDDPNPRVRTHLVLIQPDVHMGSLLKTTPNSQLFTVMGLPRTRLDETTPSSGEWTVTMEGMDVYDPVENVVHPTGADKVAAWFLDSDYDGRTFCICQAFFPDKSAWEKLERALKGIVDPEAFAAFAGTTSLPFRTGEHGRAAVKVIDPRGNEAMRVHALRDDAVYAGAQPR